MVSWLKPWLWLPPKAAHDLSQKVLPLYSAFCGSRATPQYKSFSWRGLEFKNPIGIAGGVDKSGDTLLAWQNFGAGFLEVGTITPRPQTPNPGVIIDRSTATRSLWNKMGFPNAGVEATLRKLKQKKSKMRVPIFVNVGKNRDTTNERAHEDYRFCIKAFEEVADAFVINISSPNTAGLRDLLLPENFRGFIKNIFTGELTCKPWLLKLSPDLLDADLHNVLQVACETGCDGFILTNTKQNTPELFPQHDGGGVSGRALKPYSQKFLLKTSEYLTKHSIKDKLIVSVGGIETAKDIESRLSHGANLVQVYTALIFEGPGFFRNVVKELSWQSAERKDQTGCQ